jgi:hypothetical protein
MVGRRRVGERKVSARAAYGGGRSEVALSSSYVVRVSVCGEPISVTPNLTPLERELMANNPKKCANYGFWTDRVADPPFEQKSEI